MLLIQRCSSNASDVQTLLAKLASLEKKEKIKVQVLNPQAVYSRLCIQAAIETGETKNGLLTAIALTQNFSSALKIAGARDARDFILVAWGRGVSWKKLAAALGLKKLVWGSKDAVSFTHFYGISKEALKVYPLGKLIIEKMALAKV